MDASFSPPSLPLRSPRRQALPSALLGMLMFIIAEVMFFAGTMSAFTISRANAFGLWPPPGQPRLPAESTAFNTGALLLSGVVLFIAWRLYLKRAELAKWPLLLTLVLGLAFVGLQGREWWALLAQGLTPTSSSFGSFFYLIVGGHALHATVALLALGVAWVRLLRGRLGHGLFLGAQTFWYFVVLIWPVIYGRLYF